VNFSIFLSILIPMLMTVALSYPVDDSVHGPFNHCVGRFEVYFNPKHPDPITPGRRQCGKRCNQVDFQIKI
jgi:hypothetical protein